MEKNYPSAYGELKKRICALVLGLWLIFLIFLTWAVARDFQNQIYNKAIYMVSTGNGTRLANDIPEDTPGYGSLIQIQELGAPYRWLQTRPLLPIVLDQMPNHYSTDDWFWGKWELLYGFQPAMAFFDENGEPMIASGNYLTLYYITEEDWANQNPQPSGLAYIDLDKLPQGGEQLKTWIWGFPQGNTPSSLWACLTRITGYFDGDEFIPASLDSAIDTSPLESSLEAICRSDAQDKLQWETRITQDIPAQEELVTIYAREYGGITYDPKSVTWDGKEYASLVELAQDREAFPYSNSLWENVFTLGGKGSAESGAATFRLTVRTFPLAYAALRLIPTYILGTLALGLLLWLLLRCIRRNLTKPLMDATRYLTVIPSSPWQEVRSVEESLKSHQLEVRKLQNDNQQLQTALDYAKNAEENRRQLVSNITHELKTPLAVIHSYAEGLQAGIAAEKRDKYLAVILEEVEKMDAMVLEMLDFSRLEAGKVKLSADHFSLLKLTEDIVQKLAPEAQNITYGFCNDCPITADEGRMAQVVTNLISNALRYTPEGGHIWLRIFSDENDAHFQIENSAQHLDAEALEKIFDTFYRADEARSEKGTGLGLPIARNIVQLHRGSLTARNTWVNGETCLEFAFQLPLR